MATFATWSDVVAHLEAQAAPATPAQRELAELIGYALDVATPASVAAAEIEAVLSPRIHGHEQPGATESQLKYLEVLAGVPATNMPRPVASAWITHYLGGRTARALRELRLEAGMQVVEHRDWVDEATGEIHSFENRRVVSSIGLNGLVYFRGGGGGCAWPSSLRRSSPPTA